MRAYGKKKCLISPCECCHSEAKIAKVKGNRARARREGKKEIKDGLPEHSRRKEKRTR
jgi:hypothetical protein